MIQEAINRYLQNHQHKQLSPKAVLFDMDGVLYDSMRFHAKAWKEVSEKHHLKATIEDFYLFEGRTGEGTIQRVLVTGSGQKTLIDKLEHSYPGIFSPEKMVTAFDVKYGKPNPEPYLMGLEKAGVNANEAIVVENAPMGVQAGVAAGIFTIAVNTGPLSDEVLLQAGADLLFSSVSELAEKWDEIVRATQQVSLL